MVLNSYYFNIGTNLGDRQENIRQAVLRLETAIGSHAEVSDTVESEAWGFDSNNTFLNVGVKIDSDIAPLDMLHLIQRIEREMGSLSHRNDDGSYRDRLIDIDIIAIDELVIDTPELTVPHPRMHLRDFVTRPMSQLAPDWKHPLLPNFSLKKL